MGWGRGEGYRERGRKKGMRKKAQRKHITGVEERETAQELVYVFVRTCEHVYVCVKLSRWLGHCLYNLRIVTGKWKSQRAGHGGT